MKSRSGIVALPSAAPATLNNSRTNFKPLGLETTSRNTSGRKLPLHEDGKAVRKQAATAEPPRAVMELPEDDRRDQAKVNEACAG
jgi:hypothetical protein